MTVEALALSRSVPTTAFIHRRVGDLARGRGLTPPSYSTIRAIVAAIDPGLRTLAVEGAAAYRDRFELVHRRPAARPNVQWQAEHPPAGRAGDRAAADARIPRRPRRSVSAEPAIVDFNAVLRRVARVGPVRTCVGCRKRAAKHELLRVVALDGALTVDVTGRLPGRGASVHPAPGCVEFAERRRVSFRLQGADGRPLRSPDREALAGLFVNLPMPGLKPQSGRRI